MDFQASSRTTLTILFMAALTRWKALRSMLECIFLPIEEKGDDDG